LRLMPGNAEWSCFKASLHNHLIVEIFLTVIIPLHASYTSILFYFCKKCYRGLPRLASSRGPPIAEGTATNVGLSLKIGSCGIRAFVATTYAAHPCQIPHLPIHRGERTSGHERSVAPPKRPDFLEYFPPYCLPLQHIAHPLHWQPLIFPVGTKWEMFYYRKAVTGKSVISQCCRLRARHNEYSGVPAIAAARLSPSLKLRTVFN
jgi:hypothetical protein